MKRKKITIAELFETYQAMGMKRLEPETVAAYRQSLRPFAFHFGDWRARDLTAAELLKWYGMKTTWVSGWTVKGHNIVIQRLFNWGVRAGLLKANPVRFLELDVDLPPAMPMPEVEFMNYVRAASPAWRRFLWACWWTGARPGELARARWSDVDWTGCRIILRKHKTSKKTKRPRLIYCPPAMMGLLRWQDNNRQSLLFAAAYQVLADGPIKVAELVRRLRFVHPSADRLHFHRVRQRLAKLFDFRPGLNRPWSLGPAARPPLVTDDERILTGHIGRPISKCAWTSAMGLLQETTGQTSSLYGIRRAFAHRCIKQGVHLKTASLLMGHANTKMIEQHYLAALGDDADLLQAGIAQANGKRTH